MLPNAVKLAVTASVPVECEFWTEDDGWKGACVELPVAVHGSNFEEAKKTWKRRSKRQSNPFFATAKWQPKVVNDAAQSRASRLIWNQVILSRC
jgi:uncharacterized protein (DUF1919 family)